MSIADIEEEIVSEFEILAGDMESTIFYIMELGAKLEPLAEEYQVEENIIKGCQSKVWLISELEGDKVIFKADSNTEITKGLISLLIRVWSNQSVDDIIKSELTFIERIGMHKIIGSQRSNGLSAMIKQMKVYALAYKTKISA